MNEGSRNEVVQTECRKSANNKRQRHLLCNTKDVFAFISMAACQTKEKGAFELSLKDAVAFMSANSTVDFPVCQQESAIKRKRIDPIFKSYVCHAQLDPIRKT